MGHVFAPNPDRGVFKSTDGGKTWNKILFVDDKTGAIGLVMDPRDPKDPVRGNVAGTAHTLVAR